MPKYGGRKAGTPNKLSGEVKDAFVKAFHYIQTDETSKLNNWAKKNPDKFYPLISKLFPTEIEANIDGKLIVQVIKYADHNPASE